MTKEEFIARLKELEISKQDFSQICSVPYSTINNWGIMREGKPLVIPNWVEPFLNYYEKAEKLEYVMSEICKKIEDVKK